MLLQCIVQIAALLSLVQERLCVPHSPHAPRAMSSSPVPGAGGVASEDDAAGGLREPLLANGDNGRFHDGALAAVVMATNYAHGGGCRAKEKDAVKAMDGYWVDVHNQPTVADDVEGGAGDRPLLFSNKKVMAALLYPYRVLILARLIAVILFIAWRIKHNNSDVMWFWVTSVAGDVWFALSWLLYQLPKLSPIKRTPDLTALRQHYDDLLLPDGGSILPGIDVFVTTADPVSEPVLYTMNCVLSVLATDYPVDRCACYLTDDSGALVLYEALVEAVSFAALWVPFCRKHSVEPRSPERYFQLEGMIYNGRWPGEFMNDYRLVQSEYKELKARLEMLPSMIKERSDVCNSSSMEAKEGAAHATWMSNGTQWPGTWIEPAEKHSKGDHAGIVKIVQNHPSCNCKPPADAEGGKKNPLNFAGVDTRLPMVVYVSREKRPGCEHNKKAGNLNAQLRVSALLSNAPFTINLDCDHYINNSQALRAAMCFMLDPREGDRTGFVQFPQRFHNVDPTDRYGNHNRVFVDGAMYALDGLQGPTYIGTGCVFRRLALYGVDPPPSRRRRPDDQELLVTVDTDKLGSSVLFLNSVLAALKQERRVAPPELDEAFLAEMTMVVSSSYDQGTDWGSSVGYIYNIATEDIVTGYRIHGQGWRSMYCSMEREAFQGTAPINLTERLCQIVRWSGGSMEVFFSPYNPLLSGRRLHPLQRAAYLNFTIYPVASVFVLLYAFCPVMWLVPAEIIIQRPFTRYVLCLVLVVGLVHTIGALEIRWAGIAWKDWWRNEQFFMIASLSAYPTAVLHMVLKPITGKGIHFKVTSKQTTTAADDDDDRYADMYEVRWVPMLIPPTVVLFSNVMAIGVALGKAVVYNGVWSAVQKKHAALGVLFNVWIMALLYPFGLALMGRWSKKPRILFVLLPLAFVLMAAVYIGVHSFLVKFLPFMVI